VHPEAHSLWDRTSGRRCCSVSASALLRSWRCCTRWPRRVQRARFGGYTAHATPRSILSSVSAMSCCGSFREVADTSFTAKHPPRTFRRQFRRSRTFRCGRADPPWCTNGGGFLPVRSCGIHARLDAGLLSLGVPPSRIHSEIFRPRGIVHPGISEQRPSPHAPAGPAGKGPRISFARSGLSVDWDARFQNLLELSEACDVPVRWSCRTGVCHNCEVALIGGSVTYEPEPLDPPAIGNLLICCSRPDGDLVIDL
jgi:ferredoxin